MALRQERWRRSGAVKPFLVSNYASMVNFELLSRPIPLARVGTTVVLVTPDIGWYFLRLVSYSTLTAEADCRRRSGPRIPHQGLSRLGSCWEPRLASESMA